MMVKGADYLPDAASHLGTIFINQDDHFTKDPLLNLSISAVDNSSGITLMQFSTDDQNWSAPEAYATNKQWLLTIAPDDYPPLMNTVLKTAYVRVMYGDRTWSKAFSDGIVFAKSAQDIPLIKEVWIMQQRPSPYDSSQPQGSKLNPYIVPPISNEAAFDSLMNLLAKTYASYRTSATAGQTEPPPMNGVTVMSLHLGPGTYLTHGDNGGRGGPLAWSPTTGGRIRGAGKDATILKLVGGNTNPAAAVFGNMGGVGLAVYDNLEISDLTADANMHEGGNTNSPWIRTGVTLVGNNAQLRRLRVKGFGSRVPGREPGGMNGYNAGLGNIYNFHIEDCEVLAPQSINKFYPLMFGYEGAGKDSLGNPYYMINVIIRNNYVNGLMYDRDMPVNPYTTIFLERGTHGVCLGGCKNSIVEDNFIEHVLAGYYNDTFDLNDVVVRNNHYRDVIGGLVFGTGAADKLVFEGNFIELDPHYYTAPAGSGPGQSDYGWRAGANLNENLRAPIKRAIIVSNIVQFTGRIPPMPPLTSAFANAGLSGSVSYENNTTFGITNTTVKWYQWEGPPISYYDRQVDLVNPTNLTPVSTAGNRRENGTIIEVYPYVLDKILPRPVVVPNATITFPAPLINGNVPAMVTGLPLTNVVDSNGVFTWTPGPEDIGRYVVSFYDSTSRTNDPRRTLITVQSGLTNSDALSFSSGLKGYWKLSEEFGGTFLDSSGNGNHLAIISSAQNYLDRGVPGHRAGQKALHFVNVNPAKTPALTTPNDHAQLFSGFSLAYQPFIERSTVLTRPFTTSYWFKADHEPMNLEAIFNYGSMVVCGVGPGSQTNDNLAEVFFDCGYSPDVTMYHGLHPQSINVSIGEWHHQVFVYDGLGIRLYIDGNKRAEIPCGQIEDFDVSNSISLGGGWRGDNYLGSLSDLAIWNRPFSDDEVARLYVSQNQDAAPLFPPANLKTGP